jgi:hypothetical protein
VQAKSANQKVEHSAEETLLSHLLECETCLAIVADLRVAAAECAARCPKYRRLTLTSRTRPEKRLRAGG